ncbi:Rof/RNase P-like protein [Ephemerocybe angulata]|uniref:Ribonuclease P protein subunit n=1 Tax=Ephemerocybe angulata TaxID=980116 RepID=A0A8H6HH42_9AGAR|nr:Rof/RNase P-like protein [Tulosesus angulatus]
MSSQPNIDVYAPLPFKSKLDAQKTTLTLSSTSPFAPSHIISSVTQNSDPTAIYNNRVKGRTMLLENPAKDSRLKKDLERKVQLRKEEKERRKLGIVGRKKRQERGIWKFDRKEIKYAQLLPLHHLWIGYMSELLGLPSPPAGTVRTDSLGSGVPSSASMHPKLLKADFHGAVITVKDSKNNSLVGKSGILIHETENAFKLVTPENQVKMIPKENSIFAFAVPVYSTLPPSFSPGTPYPLPSIDTQDVAPSPFIPSSNQTVLEVPHLLFDLYGNQFRFRSSERAGRKFKHKETIEL